jgi:hypothetical protein
MWADMIETHLIGPYYFDGPVDTTSYTGTLKAWLIPEIRDR